MHPLNFVSRRCLSFVALSALVSACAAGGTGSGGNDADGGNGGGGSSAGGAPAGGSGGDGGNTGSAGGFQVGGGGSGGGFVGKAEVFGHSKSALFRLDPETKAVGNVGPFSGASNIEDIALDKDSNLYGTNAEGLYSIDKVTAECTLIAAGDYPNSLSFVPAGTLDPNQEALVGFLDDQYVRINVGTGSITPIGSPWNNDFISSGDVVSVKNGPTYLTIKDAPGQPTVTCKDCLVEINPATGTIIQSFGPLGYEKVFGTAFWAGSVYGFTNQGELFEITIQNGTPITTLITTPDGLSFWGAGSTTSAPPVPQ